MSWYIDKVWLLNQISLAQLKKNNKYSFYYNKFIIYLCKRNNGGNNIRENFRQATQTTINQGSTQVLWKGKHFLICKLMEIQYSQRHIMINHCDRHITHLSNLDISFVLLNKYLQNFFYI